MARSRRKYKANKPKVRVGVRKKANKLKPLREVVLPGLNQVVTLTQKKSISSYGTVGLLHDSNALRAPETPLSDEVMEELQSDELRSVLGKQRKDGKTAELKRLTAMQRVYVSRLILKHGNDFEAMAKDLKLNRMQHSPAMLKKLCARFHKYDKLDVC